MKNASKLKRLSQRQAAVLKAAKVLGGISAEGTEDLAKALYANHEKLIPWKKAAKTTRLTFRRFAQQNTLERLQEGKWLTVEEEARRK